MGIAMVLYNEGNIISICSILLSLLSVASKSFVFSIATAMNLKQLFFNWLCAITDVIGIFFIVSWVFYEPQNEELHNAFNLFQNIWFYKLACMVLPLILAVSTTFSCALMYDVRNADTGIICKLLIISFVGSFSFTAAMIAGFLSFEILSWTWLCGFLWMLGTERFPDNKTSAEF